MLKDKFKNLNKLNYYKMTSNTNTLSWLLSAVCNNETVLFVLWGGNAQRGVLGLRS